MDAPSSMEEVTAFYDLLAPVYDRLVPPGPWSFHDQVVSRVEALVTNRRRAAVDTYDSAADRVDLLDLGCGTGTFLSELRARKPLWRLCGLDASRGMLAVAKGKAGSETILWARGRFDRPLPLSAQFEVVSIFDIALAHMPDRSGLVSAFRSATSVLRPTGVLVFDMMSEEGISAWSGKPYSVEVRDFRLRVERDYDPGTRRGYLTLTYNDATGDCRCTTFRRWFSDAEIEAALREAGFGIEVSAPWSRFVKDDRAITWYVAIRRP